jgi:hypothetical protein
MIHDHVLLPQASRIEEAAACCLARLTDELIDEVVALIPDVWLEGEDRFPDAAAHRAAYTGFLRRRRAHAPIFTEEAVRAHARVV